MAEKQPAKPVKDADYWAKLHIRSDRSRAVDLKPKLRGDRMRSRGEGMRYERGGYKGDER